ncbi:MAG: Crp/Fnr family transcriptional regulator [Armatimonadota bacterium]
MVAAHNGSRAGVARRTDQYLALVSRLKYFRRMRRPELKAMLEGAHERRVRRGETLLNQGSPAAAAYLLIHGRMKVTYVDPEGSRIVVRFVSPGEFMGGLRLLGIPNYMTSSEATDDSRVLAWDQATATRLMTRYAGISVSVAEFMADEIRELIHRLAEISTLPVEQRLASAVLRLAQPTEAGKPSALQVSRQDLAEFSGMTLHTVSRIISNWTRRKLVGGGRMRLIIIDPPRLSAIATRAHPRA